MTQMPRLLVSRCLIGEPVRYDGGHRLSTVLRDDLSPHYALIPVCPEVDAGMGVPRPPIDLVSSKKTGVRVIDRAGGKDWTDPLGAVAESLRIQLLGEPVDGCIWKARSPSCGLGTARQYVDPEGTRLVDGVVVAAIKVAFPWLPMIDESALLDEEKRSVFEVGVAIEYLRRTLGCWPAADWVTRIRNGVCEDGVNRSSSEEEIPQLLWDELSRRLGMLPVDSRNRFATSARTVHRTIGAVIAGTGVPLKSER